MAVIGKIRQRSGLLIFLIGLSIVGFLVMDATNSQFSVLRGRKDYIGKVNGEKIMQLDFEKKLDENVKSQEEQMRGQPLNDDMRNYLRNQTWNDMVSDIIFKDVYNQLGLNVTADEMSDLATSEEFASQYLKQDQSFRNPQTGQFDPNMVRMFLQNLDRDPEGVEPGTIRRQWMRFEALLKKQQFQDKYNNLITKALVAPTWMAEMNYYDQARTADIAYIQLPFSAINDNDLKISDDEVKEYISSHKALFRQENETRKIQYVAFDIVPSSADTARTIRELEEKRAEFAQAKTAADDSVFVRLYSDIAFDEVFYDKEKLISPVKDSLFSLPVKSLVGPYMDGKSVKLAKISDRRMISDSVRIRQIQISFSNIKSQEEATAKFAFVDSVFKAIDSLKADFGMMAALYSDDAATKVKGGDIGWVKQGAREKAMNDLIFYRAEKGKTYRMPSQQENAWYIFQIVEDKPSKLGVQVSYLSREIIPSQETQNNIYEAASTFASDNQTKEKFVAAGQKRGVKTVENIGKEEFSVSGLGAARTLVKWAFEAKAGDVSSPITIDNKHVIAMVELVRPEGIMDVASARADAYRYGQIVREKKTEQLTAKIKAANASTLEALVAKLNVTVQTASGVSGMNATLNGAYEPAVVAAAIAAGANKISAPVKGLAGVYVAKATAVNEPPKATDYSVYGMQLKQQAQGKSRYATEVQKKLADIEDSRFEFF